MLYEFSDYLFPEVDLIKLTPSKIKINDIIILVDGVKIIVDEIERQRCKGKIIYTISSIYHDISSIPANTKINVIRFKNLPVCKNCGFENPLWNNGRKCLDCETQLTIES